MGGDRMKKMRCNSKGCYANVEYFCFHCEKAVCKQHTDRAPNGDFICAYCGKSLQEVCLVNEEGTKIIQKDGNIWFRESD